MWLISYKIPVRKQLIQLYPQIVVIGYGGSKWASTKPPFAEKQKLHFTRLKQRSWLQFADFLNLVIREAQKA